MPRADDRPLLVAEGLSKWYGKQLGCRDVSFALYPGEVVAVVGESGSGKTTLLQLISSQLEAPPVACSIACADGIRLPVVSGVEFAVQAGECAVLAGPSGAGKSSILKMIFGTYRSTRAASSSSMATARSTSRPRKSQDRF